MMIMMMIKIIYNVDDENANNGDSDKDVDEDVEYNIEDENGVEDDYEEHSYKVTSDPAAATTDDVD